MSVIYDAQRVSGNALFDNYYVPEVPTLNSTDIALIVAGLLAAARGEPIYSHVRIIHDVTLAGAGTPADPMRPA